MIGTRDLAQRVYEGTIRRRLPRTLGVYNGVITRKYYLLDLQGRTHEPQYKQELVDSVRSTIKPGDTVVEIGGGYGVCTARAANFVGENGRIICYEANAEQIGVIKEALELTGDVLEESIQKRVEVHHAVVGSEVKIYGSMAGASRMNLSELPACDVLMMDCEGAERTIVHGMEIEPRNVVVETHPQQGSPTNEIAQTLSSHGYAIDSMRVTMTDAGSKDIVTATLEDR